MAAFGDKDVDSMIDYLWLRYRVSGAIQGVPIDLWKVAELQRVKTVDVRPMLCAGGLTISENGFTVYIRDMGKLEPQSFGLGGLAAGYPHLSRRQRFTLAHEIGHTLFFQDTNPPRLRQGAAKGKKLEALCHRAALRILLPTPLIEADLRTEEKIGASQVLRITKKYEASPEAVLSRLDELPILRDTNQAILYVRKSHRGVDEIARYLCPNWFKDRFTRPEINSSIAAWMSKLIIDAHWSDPNATFSIPYKSDQLRIANVPYGEGRYFIELEHIRKVTDVAT